MTLLKKFSTSWNIVGQRCQQLILQTDKTACSKRLCILFCHLLLTVCLLPTFPKRKLLLSASPLIRDKMAVLDSAAVGESSIQYFWIFTGLFWVHFLKERDCCFFCFWKLKAKFSVPGEVLIFFLHPSSLPSLWKPFPWTIHYFAGNQVIFLWKVDCCKNFPELHFHCWPMRADSMGLEATFEQHEYKILYLNVEMKPKLWDQLAPCFKTRGGRAFFVSNRNILRFS